MSKPPITRSDIVAVALIWGLVLVGLMFQPSDTAVEAQAVSCAHGAG